MLAMIRRKRDSTIESLKSDLSAALVGVMAVIYFIVANQQAYLGNESVPQYMVQALFYEEAVSTAKANTFPAPAVVPSATNPTVTNLKFSNEWSKWNFQEGAPSVTCEIGGFVTDPETLQSSQQSSYFDSDSKTDATISFRREVAEIEFISPNYINSGHAIKQADIAKQYGYLGPEQEHFIHLATRGTMFISDFAGKFHSAANAFPGDVLDSFNTKNDIRAGSYYFDLRDDNTALFYNKFWNSLFSTDVTWIAISANTDAYLKSRQGQTLDVDALPAFLPFAPFGQFNCSASGKRFAGESHLSIFFKKPSPIEPMRRLHLLGVRVESSELEKARTWNRLQGPVPDWLSSSGNCDKLEFSNNGSVDDDCEIMIAVD